MDKGQGRGLEVLRTYDTSGRSRYTTVPQYIPPQTPLNVYFYDLSSMHFHLIMQQTALLKILAYLNPTVSHPDVYSSDVNGPPTPRWNISPLLRSYGSEGRTRDASFSVRSSKIHNSSSNFLYPSLSPLESHPMNTRCLRNNEPFSMLRKQGCCGQESPDPSCTASTS